ncbi:L-asparaginase precursor [uncultured Clostridium sp.]|nr:L-asparaginase precursor [uncultured Clostridium sp.]
MNKKQIYILATGGTISAQGDEGKTLGYTNGVFKVKSLIKSIKGIEDVTKVNGEQIFNIASEDMSIDKLLILAKRINELSKLDNIDGFVITQGTDILEESAFF